MASTLKTDYLRVKHKKINFQLNIKMPIISLCFLSKFATFQLKIMNRKLLILGIVILIVNGLQAQEIKEMEGRYYKNNEAFTGKYTTLYESGNMKMEASVKNGNKHGKVTTWFENGTLNEIRSYRKNQMHGKWEKYNNKGILISVARYKNGVKHGKWKIWDDQGNLMYELQYNNGSKSGTWKNYDIAGNVVNERKY